VAHLEVLKEKFPNEIMLGIEQVATVLRKSKKTLQNQISKKTFPCRVLNGTVSIVELARHLDSEALYTPPAEPKVRRGRKPARPELDVLLSFWSSVVLEIERLDAENFASVLESEIVSKLPASSTKTERL
jgi:hypothetical protein